MSAGAAFGSHGFFKATYVGRRTMDFVEDFIDPTTGINDIVEDGEDFGAFNNIVFRNSNEPTRVYDGLVFQSHYTFGDRWLNGLNVDGSWTVQLRNEGNFEGEATNVPATSSALGDFPEIFTEERHFPVGRLDEFQRHKLRLWGIYPVGLGRFGTLDVGTIWRYDSGLAYSLVASGAPLSEIQEAGLDASGYQTRPDSQTIYFGGRGIELFEGVGLLDLSFNYSIPVWRAAAPWIKIEFYNILNNDELVFWNTEVAADPESPLDALGIPTGFVPGPRFGEGTSTGDYPAPQPGETGLRTFLVSLGFRL